MTGSRLAVSVLARSEGMGISGAQARQLKQEDILKSSVLFQRNQQPAGGSPSSKGTPRGT